MLYHSRKWCQGTGKEELLGFMCPQSRWSTVRGSVGCNLAAPHAVVSALQLLEGLVVRGGRQEVAPPHCSCPRRLVGREEEFVVLISYLGQGYGPQWNSNTVFSQNKISLQVPFGLSKVEGRHSFPLTYIVGDAQIILKKKLKEH